MRGRNRPVLASLVSGDEPRPDHAFLHPGRVGPEPALRCEAGELGAGSGAAGRAVIGAAGAEHETARIRVGRRGDRTVRLIDLRAVSAGHAVAARACLICSAACVSAGIAPGSIVQGASARKNQLPPQAISPVDVAEPLHCDCRVGVQKARDVLDGRRVAVVQLDRHDPDRRFEALPAGASRPICASVTAAPIVAWPHMPR